MDVHHVRIGGASLAVHSRGAGLPLVLLHAFPLDHAMWERQAPLADHVRLIVPDLRGFGGSSGSTPESMAGLADDVAAILDALHVQRPAVICGVSMGGYVAQHVAARHPGKVAAVVLVDTRLEADTDEARAGRADLAAKVGRLGTTILADAMVPRLLGTSAAARTEPYRSHLEGFLREMIARQPVATIQAALAALGSRPDMTAAMSRVLHPTLLVVGAEDAITPPECLARAEKLMPAARLLIVPEAGHLVPLEQPQVFNAAMVDFLQAAGIPAEA